MNDALQLLLIVSIYLCIGYLFTRFVNKWTKKLKPILQILIRSFFYALIWGVGIAATGGDPGFAFPAPNIAALILMAYIGFFNGLLNGLIILFFWWFIFFIILIITHFASKHKQPITNSINK